MKVHKKELYYLWQKDLERSGSVYNFIMDNIVLINIFLALVIVFFQRRSPQTVWTWAGFLLYFIPILGFVMYLIIGQDFHKSRMFKAKGDRR